jgi:hypothetical protein
MEVEQLKITRKVIKRDQWWRMCDEMVAMRLAPEIAELKAEEGRLAIACYQECYCDQAALIDSLPAGWLPEVEMIRVHHEPSADDAHNAVFIQAPKGVKLRTPYADTANGGCYGNCKPYVPEEPSLREWLAEFRSRRNVVYRRRDTMVGAFRSLGRHGKSIKIAELLATYPDWQAEIVGCLEDASDTSQTPLPRVEGV